MPSRRPTQEFDPAAGIAVVLAGCFLTFYLVGLPMIALGAWMLRRGERAGRRPHPGIAKS
jgi:hypothetical protein